MFDLEEARELAGVSTHAASAATPAADCQTDATTLHNLFRQGDEDKSEKQAEIPRNEKETEERASRGAGRKWGDRPSNTEKENTKTEMKGDTEFKRKGSGLDTLN
ncbi:hypothetical protein NDU88_004026 [Pleurodeles waltl]|uniref:Uncharacterized protein n=1 Tax=Pleurodeles waltl TaxID=8319 RepID=A0AAV7LPR6_PLEWA|nr:hypothetical protein NDU88_004026 [Pleurodeles waltl]